MKILFLARRFYPQIGGVEKHVLEISKLLVKKGHKVVVIAELEKNTNSQNKHSASKSATMTGEINGIEIFRIDAGGSDWFKKFRIWWQILRLNKLIQSADIVHCHDVFFWYLPFRFLFPAKKVYTTFHGYEGDSLPTTKAIMMHKIAEKLSSGNICIGKFLEKWYGTKATYISYGAVNISNQKTNIIADKNLIVFLGRLEEETGILEYLKAFKKLSSEHNKLRLEVVGDGSLMGKAREYAKINGLKVTFRGFLKNTDEIIQRASFMFVSRYLGILESMVNKKYVLAVYNNKVKEDYLRLTPFANFISISSNANEIYREFNKVIQEKNTEDKIQKTYDWVKTETWEKMVNLYLKLWGMS